MRLWQLSPRFRTAHGCIAYLSLQHKSNQYYNPGLKGNVKPNWQESTHGGAIRPRLSPRFISIPSVVSRNQSPLGLDSRSFRYYLHPEGLPKYVHLPSRSRVALRASSLSHDWDGGYTTGLHSQDEPTRGVS